MYIFYINNVILNYISMDIISYYKNKVENMIVNIIYILCDKRGILIY